MVSYETLCECIQDLERQKADVEAVISTLERIQSRGTGDPIHKFLAKRRGRKGMGTDERKEVSKRMTKYWSNRRIIPPPE